MKNLMKNSNLSSELGYHVKRNREIAKIYWKTRENSKKSRESLYNLIRKVHGIVKVLQTRGECNSLSFLKISAILKIFLLVMNFSMKIAILQFYFFLYLGQFCWQDSFQWEILHGKYIFGYFLYQIRRFVWKISKNDDKSFFPQKLCKNSVKHHIGRNFEYFELIFNESLYFLVYNRPVNLLPILDFYLVFFVPFRWNAPFSIFLLMNI